MILRTYYNRDPILDKPNQLKLDKYDALHHSDRAFAIDAVGSDAPLELQSQLGLRTQRRARPDPADFNYLAGHGTHLTTKIGCDLTHFVVAANCGEIR
jgi:hypothetical protein